MDLKHWKLSTDADNLAWLYFDRAGAGTNTFSSEALRELGRGWIPTMPSSAFTAGVRVEAGDAKGNTGGEEPYLKKNIIMASLMEKALRKESIIMRPFFRKMVQVAPDGCKY